ncbi:MAG: alanyl-tRNA editing protein [Coprothermobacterota bacterium]|nr:alanyl-tRNA editing protein [Coprothermobacterota bacterium]
MTELIYQLDSACRHFKAIVLAEDLSAHAVALDRTSFYSGGGGQPADRGWLRWSGGEAILGSTQKRDENLWHCLEGLLPQVGTEVEGILDWPRRYALMRTHSALHILCGVVWRDYGAQVTGGSMEPLEGRMDFEFETMRHELVAEIELRINAEVAAARAVHVQILPRDEAFQIPDLIRTKVNLLPEGIPFVRTVEILGLDLQADGGTHVANTREVGPIRVVEYKSKGKINKRIYIRLEPNTAEAAEQGE